MGCTILYDNLNLEKAWSSESLNPCKPHSPRKTTPHQMRMRVPFSTGLPCFLSKCREGLQRVLARLFVLVNFRPNALDLTFTGDHEMFSDSYVLGPPLFSL